VTPTGGRDAAARGSVLSQKRRERLLAFARSPTLQDVFQADVLFELGPLNTQAAADELMHLSIRRKAVR